MEDNSARTAITRKKPSFPIQFLVESGYISGRVVHFGSGKDDHGTHLLKTVASEVSCYDPNFAPDKSVVSGKYSSVVSNYVLNVLSWQNRKEVLEQIHQEGKQAMSEADQAALNNWVKTVHARIWNAAALAGLPPTALANSPAERDGTGRVVDARHGFCLRIPAAYTVFNPNTNEIVIAKDSLLNATGRGVDRSDRSRSTYRRACRR